MLKTKLKVLAQDSVNSCSRFKPNGTTCADSLQSSTHKRGF